MMRRQRTGMVTLTAAAALLWSAAFALTAGAETLAMVPGHGEIEYIDANNPPWDIKKAPDKVLETKTITFNITFEDQGTGFNDPALGAQRRARLDDALTYVASVLNINNRTLDIRAQPSLNTGTGFLAQAFTFFALSPGFQNGSAFQRLSTGVKPFANTDEIVIRMNFGYNWNIGTGPPAQNEYDLISVLVHEITHGLGILSLSGQDGAGQIQGSPNTYTVWDQLMARRAPFFRLWMGNPPSFQGSQADLQSNDLAFDGAQAFQQYAQGTRPGVFAPSPFIQGSSLSHFDTGNIVGGAVMEHSISPGVQRRTFAPMEIGALRDLGYTNAGAPQGFTLSTAVQGQGSVTRNPNLASYTAGQLVTLTAVPAGGFQFSNWIGNVANTNSATTTITMNQNESVTAVFTPVPQTFTLNVSVQGQGSVTRNPNQANYTAGQVVTLTAVPAGGFQFSNWIGNVANTNSANTTITMNQNQNVTAVFTALAPPNLQGVPGVVDFGGIPVGEIWEALLTIENTGGQPLIGQGSITGSAAFFVHGSASYNIPGGGSQQFTVRFAPQETGNFNAVLNLTGDPGGTVQVTLLGTGQKAGAGCHAGSGSARDPIGDIAVVLGVLALLAYAGRARKITG